MKILTVNVGSSAVKYTLFSNLKIEHKKTFTRKDASFSENEEKFLLTCNPDYIVFRVVHTLGETKTQFITNKTKQEIKEALVLAPIHNKLLLDLLDNISTIYSQEKFIAVFDSEFHKDLPDLAARYAIPKEFSLSGRLRKYGFHGLALEAIVDHFKQKLAYVPENIIAVHAGGGVSVTAISKGVSVDTTMGITPTDGVMMLTRSGALDPEIYRILHDLYGLSFDDISNLLNLESGFFALTGSKDTKDIIEKAKKDIEPFNFAYKLFLYQIKKYIYAFWGVLGGHVDFITLSGGIAYNNKYFAEDLWQEIVHLNLKKEQVLKVDVQEDKIMLKKAIDFLSNLKSV